MTALTPDAVMYDAIEHALWQDLADALHRLEEYGLDPLPGVTEVDAGAVIHGGGVRPEGGYRLVLDGAGWVVEGRAGAR